MPLKASKLDFLKNFEILGLSSNFSKNFNFEALRGIFGHSEENKKVLELNFTPDNTP